LWHKKTLPFPVNPRVNEYYFVVLRSLDPLSYRIIPK
jgi:hypothetical protein